MISTNNSLNNKKLYWLSWVSNINILSFSLFGILNFIFRWWLNVINITTQHSFMSFIFQAGKLSFLQKYWIQGTNNTTVSTDIPKIIQNFITNLTIDLQNTTGSGSIDFHKFSIFNLIVQISTIVFIFIIVCLIIISYFLIDLIIVSIKQNNLNNLLIVLFVGLFGSFSYYLFIKLWKNPKPRNIWNINVKWVHTLYHILSKRKNLNINNWNINDPLIQVRKLNFAYNTKHSKIKHFLDYYKNYFHWEKIKEEDHLSKKHHSKKILKNVDLDIYYGKINVIIGPNGCGKSTLLKLIINIFENYIGSIYWCGELLQEINKKNFYKMISYLPQNLNIPKNISVYDFISYSRLSHRDDNFDNKDVLSVLEAIRDSKCVDIDYENKFMHELSGGQKQKILIASLLAKKPKVIFLDEPINSLDIKNQLYLLNFLKKISREKSVTIVIVLHDLHYARDFADHLIVMKESKVYSAGSPKTIINKKMLLDVFNIDESIF